MANLGAIKAAHKAVLKQETVVSTAINAGLPATIIWFLNVSPPQSLIGANNILAAIVLASGLATFIMTFVLTFIIRARVSKGVVPALDWPLKQRGFYRFIPANLLLRAASLGIAAVILLVPVTLALVSVLDILPLTKKGALIFNIMFGATVGLFMTRFVVITALADGSSA